jgi:nicotinamidase-related amidase
MNPITAQRGDSIILLVDMQERLAETVSDSERLKVNLKAIIKTAQTLKIPVIHCEQDKLGETLPDLSLPPTDIIKTSFSLMGEKKFTDRLKGYAARTVIVCGIETHICVQQTAADLMLSGYNVFIPADATSSNHKLDHKIALKRMSGYGAVITSTESLIYELTEKAGTPEFKEILEIAKERRKNITV